MNETNNTTSNKEEVLDFGIGANRDRDRDRDRDKDGREGFLPTPELTEDSAFEF